MQNESLFDLAGEARAMLLDRSKQERDLIYHIAQMPDILRAAIILAYQGLHDDQPNA